MITKHIGAAFNHSCLKVPVNPTNNLPLPTYERKRVPHYLENELDNKEMSHPGTDRNYEFLHTADRPSSSDSRIARSKSSTPQGSANSALKTMGESTNKESLKSFIDFYESIPDYGDLNHLSDREFYIRLQHLKAKQRTYLRDLNDKDFDASEVVEENKINSRKYEEKNVAVSSETWQKQYTSNDNLNLRGKKCDLDAKSPLPSSSYQKSPKKYSDMGVSALLWDKMDSKAYVSPSPTVSALSLDDSCKINSRTNPKSSIQLNNYVLNTDEQEILSRPGKENKFRNPITQRDLYKMKLKKSNNGTNKVRDTHTASANKTGVLTGDSSSSIVESMWDGFSVDDYIPKAELYSDYESEEDLLDLPFAHSVPNSPALKQSKNVAWREPKITIPKPFNMTLRSFGSPVASQQISVISSHLIMGVVWTNLLWRILGNNSVGKLVYTIHTTGFTWVNDEQSKYKHLICFIRRRQVRRQCMNELRAQMKPFKFMKRDEERKRLRMCHSTPDLREFDDSSTTPKPFRAKPVPKNLFSNYVYQRMREDEYYRSLKRKIRAEELLKSSSLPPSMAARERLSKAKAMSEEVLNRDLDKPRRKKHKIPNYKKSHEQMRKELEERWNDNITTSPQPFTLKTAELHQRKFARFTSPDGSSNSSPYEMYSPSVSKEHIRPRSALGIPLNRNNLASVLRIQSSRQRMERELAMKQEEIRKKEEAKMKAHITRRKPAWQALNYSTEEDLAMRIQTRREEERIRREEFEQDMEHMLNRVERIPTLFERQTQLTVKESQKSHRKSRGKSGHSMKISSIPTTPDLYEEDEDEDEDEDVVENKNGKNVSRNEVSDDKNMKMGLKVSISETPETIQCPSEPEELDDIKEEDEKRDTEKTVEEEEEEQEEDEQKDIKEIKENKHVEEKEEDECENTDSIQEDITTGKSTDVEDDDEDGNTYTLDD
ncbi:uncharacterized protein [Periplaneta americana]|uniref:uncharacterized protein n=1 Tax=Periplaneta americana TaxID=6978 RepID=UPI0037E779E3